MTRWGVAHLLDKSTANLTLVWVRKQPRATSPPIGAREPTEIQRGVGWLSMTLPPDVRGDLKEATDPMKRDLGASPGMWLSENRMR